MLHYVKNQFIAADDAMIHISERGFRFGDGVFETIRVECSVALHLEQHLQRLSEGMAALAIPTLTQDLSAICYTLIQRNSMDQGILRLCVSRGIGSQGYLPLPNIEPTLVIESLPPLTNIHDPTPVTLWLSTIRKTSPSALPVAHKLSQGLNSILARQEAANHGCDEALMLNEAGQLCECSSSNIFWRTNGHIYTPALECGLLAGTTRQRLLNAWGAQISTTCAPFETLANADALLCTNSISGARPVAEIASHSLQFDSIAFAQNAQALLIQQNNDYITTMNDTIITAASPPQEL